MRRRPIPSRWSATTPGPASAAWIFYAEAWSRTGPRTSMSASPISTPRRKGSRPGRLSARRSSAGAALCWSTASTNGKRPRPESSPMR
jgi:hypothetical protein